ncbi:MAG: nitroreductase family protein, partial [Methanoregula sp.]|nr:nitroreductase family protein [Methanoregula sp.]
MDSSDFYGFLECRASVREYDNEPVTEEEISYILSCASTAPSAGNLEAWDVI